MKKVIPLISVQRICRLLGYSPQAYHKKQHRNVVQLSNELLILQQIDHIRKYQPRFGGRKLFIMLQPFLKQHQITIGRDHFFDLLRRNKLSRPEIG